MVTKRKVTGTASGIPTGILFGVLLSFVITLIGVVVTAYFVSTETLLPEHVGICAMITVFVSATAGATLTLARVKRMRVQMCFAAGIGYFVFLLAITAMFFGGQYSGVGVTGATVLAGSGCAVLLSTAADKRGKRSVKKKAYR